MNCVWRRTNLIGSDLQNLDERMDDSLDDIPALDIFCTESVQP